MSGRKIKFSLVYRDMWQSSGKYMPRKDQLERIAPVIIDMGCFARVETNGGGFEQINLLFGENPNKAVRAWTKDFNAAGIKTHMLERGLNGIRMSPVPADIRKLMFKVKKKQGVDISPDLLATARRRFGEARVRWTLADAGAHDFGAPLDAIFCRNVMIYFDKPTQRRILERFVPLLAPGGLLFAGHSENFHNAHDLFRLHGKTIYEPIRR